MDSYYISNTIDDEILKCGNMVIIVIRHKGVQQIIQVVDPNLIILFCEFGGNILVLRRILKKAK